MKNFIKRHKVLIALFAVALVGSSLVIYFWSRSQKDISWAEVKRGSIIEAVYGIGTVHAARNYELKVGVPSTIKTLYIQEGDFVKKGDKLILLDGIREFAAPFDGMITALPYKVDEAVFPQVSILTLTNFKDRYLLASLEQEGAIQTKRDMKVVLSFESLRNQSFDAKVESVYSNGSQFLVRINAPKLPLAVLPGMTADVSIIIKRHQNVLLIPVAAIELGKVKRRHGKNGKTEEIPIEIGVIDGVMAQVNAGDITEGDYVIITKE